MIRGEIVSLDFEADPDRTIVHVAVPHGEPLGHWWVNLDAIDRTPDEDPGAGRALVCSEHGREFIGEDGYCWHSGKGVNGCLSTLVPAQR